jgi:(p)ppGpp synthase/HD superfamily hydrolase
MGLIEGVGERLIHQKYIGEIMNLIEKSLEIALQAYSGKVDKAGQAYILHPLRVMAKMSTDEERSVALLHEVIEDSEFTADSLLDAGVIKPVHTPAECHIITLRVRIKPSVLPIWA